MSEGARRAGFAARGGSRAPARRAAWLLAAAAALAGCGSGGPADLMRRIGQAGLDQARGELGSESAPGGGARAAAGELTRAQIEAIPAALISARIDGAPPAYFFAAAENGGYVVYQGASRQTLTLRGAALAGTRGLTEDLAGYRSDPARDPLISPRPPEAWPERLVRALRFHDRSGRLFSRVFQCAPRRAGPEEVVTIAGLDFPLVEMVERCTSPETGFVNRYWIEAETGRVWKSEQWMGPLRGTLELEVLKPYADG